MIADFDRRRSRMSQALQRIKRGTFAVISRLGLAFYSRFPIFGALRASVGLIRNGDLILVIERSDGRGLSLPGGLAFAWENSTRTLVREISEETGLSVTQSVFLFEYHATSDVPCVVSVFEVKAEGELADSWEGCPRWLPTEQARSSLLASQQRILDRLTSN
jgi:8-oxo-dGTP pyrophosphatase MutT (NUDIX family)